MLSISLCMIVKNEQELLNKCLQSVCRLCDEIIIVDTGSTDKTKQIAAEYTDKIYDFAWVNDFSAARNFAFAQATKDYILWIDADEILFEEEQKKLASLKQTLSSEVEAVSMINVAARDEYGNPSFVFRRDRLVKREKQFKWIGPVHEVLDIYGPIVESDIEISHLKQFKAITEDISNRNLKIYQSRLKQGDVFSARDWFYYSNELRDHKLYHQAIENYLYFLGLADGWSEDKIRACLYLANCYEELGNQEKELDALLRSFAYDNPRPESCCRIGDIMQRRGEHDKAIFWYNLAFNTEESKVGGFTKTDYSTWYPHLSLCVCYWNKGDRNKSIEHNNKAKTYKPNDQAILQNEKFFESLMQSPN